MDAALLIVAANEECPQPQTREHLMALEIMGIKDIIVVQNKIDLVDKEQLMKSYNQIKDFVKDTVARDAPIIPISAQHNINVDVLIQNIQERFKTPERKKEDDPIFYVARSFDVNKPGTEVKNINGGVLGGTVRKGIFKKGEVIEILPGFSFEKEGKVVWEAIQTKVEDLVKGGISLGEMGPGGSGSILTCLDPSVVKSDSLVGNVVGLPGKLPPVWHEFKLKINLLDRVVGSLEELKVEALKPQEVIVLTVNSAATVGMVNSFAKGVADVKLKVPVCCEKEDRIAISRKVGTRWRLIGFAEIMWIQVANYGILLLVVGN